MNTTLKIAALTAMLSASAAAFAAKPPPANPPAALVLGSTQCTLGDLSLPASACSGFFTNSNLLGNSPTMTALTTSVLTDAAALGHVGGLFGLSAPLTIMENIPDLQINPITGLHDLPAPGNFTINFNTPLSGDTVVGIHFGGGGANGTGGGTAFYRFDAGAYTDSFTVNYQGVSDAVLYQTSAVPEPGTYGMMLAGLGLVGLMARRRKA
ncbi:MAG: PEP-CTERM sorting domain-containing protein [Pseudomonadota bacterium]